SRASSPRLQGPLGATVVPVGSTCLLRMRCLLIDRPVTFLALVAHDVIDLVTSRCTVWPWNLFSISLEALHITEVDAGREMDLFIPHRGRLVICRLHLFDTRRAGGVPTRLRGLTVCGTEGSAQSWISPERTEPLVPVLIGIVRHARRRLVVLHKPSLGIRD